MIDMSSSNGWGVISKEDLWSHNIVRHTFVLVSEILPISTTQSSKPLKNSLTFRKTFLLEQ